MMKLSPVAAAVRPASAFSSSLSRRGLFPLQRNLATTHRTYAADASSSAKRRSVTPFNDDGHVPWSHLSSGEKAGRAVQQSFNFGMVIVGMVLTGGVGYLLYSEVFSSDSKVSHFNRAVDRIKKDPRCLELLGDSRKITAHGEETSNKWRRARPIASTIKKDPQGNEHLIMNFFVEGPRGSGQAALHLIKGTSANDFEYKYFFVDVRGHQRIYLENAAQSSAASTKQKRLFGINWG